MALLDFRCTKCRTVHDRPPDTEPKDVRCPQCGAPSERMTSYRFPIPGAAPQDSDPPAEPKT